MCQSLTAMAKANLHTVYLWSIDSVSIDFIHNAQKAGKILIDSGATDNCMHPHMAEWLGLHAWILTHPWKIMNVNGTENRSGTICQYIDTKITLGKHTKAQRFYITDIGSKCAILGYTFLWAFNPKIDWQERTLDGQKVVQLEAEKRDTYLKVCMLQTLAIKTCGKLWNNKEIWMQKATFAQQWASATNNNKQKLTETNIPEEYKHHACMFSKSAAQALPPLWEENFAINLKPNAPAELMCKVYPLNQPEMEELRKNLEKDCMKGFIKDGSSPYTMPIFFIPKKDTKELQMIVNYRKLNDVTIKDDYPLPDVWYKLDKLCRKTLFTKVDLHSGYNNICLEPKDAWKASFKTPLGMHILQVMGFGFSNAPPLFQCAMNQDLQPIKDKYTNNFANYLDNCIMATGDSPAQWELHQEIIHLLLQLLEKHHYFLKASKCKFKQPEVEFLGFRVKDGELQINPSKILGL